MADDERIDELIHAWIDGELDPARADDLLAALRGDRSLLAKVEAFERIADDARELPAPPLPHGFVERAMERVREERVPRRSWARARLFQRRFEFSLAQIGLATLALAPAIVFAGSVGFSQGRNEAVRAIAASPAGEAELVRFALHAEEASSVELAGSFNGWAPAPLTRLPDGTFEAVLPLPKGRHEYAFRVDGTWQADPAAEVIVDDGFGGRNAVIEL